MCHYIDQGQAEADFYIFVMTELLTVSCLHEFPVSQRESQPPQGTAEKSSVVPALQKIVYKYMVFFSHFTFISSFAFPSP